MIADVYGHVIGGFVPAGLTWHIVVDGTAVDFQTLESDVAHTTLFVVTVDDGDIGRTGAIHYNRQRLLHL